MQDDFPPEWENTDPQTWYEQKQKEKGILFTWLVVVIFVFVGIWLLSCIGLGFMCLLI